MTFRLRLRLWKMLSKHMNSFWLEGSDESAKYDSIEAKRESMSTIAKALEMKLKLTSLSFDIDCVTF